MRDRARQCDHATVRTTFARLFALGLAIAVGVWGSPLRPGQAGGGDLLISFCGPPIICLLLGWWLPRWSDPIGVAFAFAIACLWGPTVEAYLRPNSYWDVNCVFGTFWLVFLSEAAVACLAWLLVCVFRGRPDIPLRSCGVCGYNLTGNVSGLCPECGTVVPSYARTVILDPESQLDPSDDA